MKHGGKTFICLLSSFALTMGSKAISSAPGGIKHGENAVSIADTRNTGETPYSTIVVRNIFSLNDPGTNVVNAPSSNVTLTGITTILGMKQALFMVQKSAGLPESYFLTEGQRQGELEVLKIDQKEAKVTIKNGGVVSTITFEAPKAETSGVPMNSPTPMSRPGFNSRFKPDVLATPPPPIP